MKKKQKSFSLNLSFEKITLPPFRDIIILGKRCQHGKVGVTKSLSLLAPDSFELVEIDNEDVAAILVNRQLIKSMTIEKIIDILEEDVFPSFTAYEIIKVDFDLQVKVQNIEGEL